MNIEEIQKYIKDNNITSDFENDYRPIDYVDTIGLHAMSKEKAQEIFDELKEVIRQKGIKITFIDSLNLMSP